MRATRIRHDIVSCDIISVSGIHDQRYKAARRYDRSRGGQREHRDMWKLMTAPPATPLGMPPCILPPYARRVRLQSLILGWAAFNRARLRKRFRTRRNSESLIDMAADLGPRCAASAQRAARRGTTNGRNVTIHARAPARGTESG